MEGGDASPTNTFKGSALGANAFAGGKGRGKSKGKGRNPCDPSGRQMECYRCGSKDHLSMNCPVSKGKGGGGGPRKGGFFEDSSSSAGWTQGAVDGTYDHCGFVEEAPKAFLGVSGDDLHDEDGDYIPEEYAAPHRDIVNDYECSWTSEPLGAGRTQEVMFHSPVSQPQVFAPQTGEVMSYFRPPHLRESTVKVESVASDEVDPEADVGDWCGPGPASQTAGNCCGSPQVVMHLTPGNRPSGFPKPKPIPRKGKGRKNEEWQSVLPQQPSSEGWFPTEIEAAYLASVRLAHGTSLLILSLIHI